MLPGQIKTPLTKALSSIFAISLFILMLPLTIGIAILMLLTGIVTFATLNYQLRKRVTDIISNGEIHATEPQMKDNELKPPIEGSYRVIDK